jgi:hypothetical protein
VGTLQPLIHVKNASDCNGYKILINIHENLRRGGGRGGGSTQVVVGHFKTFGYGRGRVKQMQQFKDVVDLLEIVASVSLFDDRMA